jgi:hypothetical protein
MWYSMHIYFICSLVWCTVCSLIWMDGCVYACNRIENDPVEEPEELAGEAPEQQSIGGGKCPLTYLCPIHSLIHLPHYTFILKDWLAFVIHVLGYLFGLDYYCLALCYCSNSNQWTWWDYLWYAVFPSLIMMLYLWSSRGARAVSRVPLRKDLFYGWPPGKTVQPWGWNGMPLAE